MSFQVKTAFGFLMFCVFLSFACQTNFKTPFQKNPSESGKTFEKPKLSEIESEPIKKLLESAVRQTNLTKNYDPAYKTIAYPNGDVPVETGVCSDVVIRAFRNADIDLQKEIHEDMTKNFAAYPKKWNLKSPDTNIDHRRVPNLETFFTRRGKSLPVTRNPEDYKPGDVVSWDLNGKGMTHTGIVSNIFDENTRRYLIIHNIGAGAQAEDVVFNWKITGHFRYF